MSPEANHRIQAAEGWLMLGCPEDALAELREVPTPYCDTPGALDLTWQALAARKQWDDAYAIGLRLVTDFPAEVTSWIHRAYAARRRTGGGLLEAFDLLAPAAEKFSEEPLIPYNLACYLAQLGRDEEAWTWFRTALDRGNAAVLRTMALADEDLRPIWPRVALLA
jgi:hypothetical protein